MTTRLIGPLLTAFLTLPSLSADGQVQVDLHRPAKMDKIHPLLKVSLDEKANVWVFFTDKGIFDDESLQRALVSHAQKLDPYACARRLKVKNRPDLVDFTDLPLHEPYVQKILDLGVHLRARSKWLNAISIRADGEQIHGLVELPFVFSLRQVVGSRRRDFEAQPVGALKPFSKNRLFVDYGPSLTHLSQITVPQLHQWMDQMGIGPPGDGIRICLLDSGFQLFHESLQHLKILAKWDFINDDDVVADEEGDPEGQSSHGTTILTIIGGYTPGQLIGPAYGATFLLGKTEDHGDEQPIEEDYWVAGIEWAEGLGTDVVSSSLGYNDWYTYSDMDGNTAVTTVAADLAASKGLVVVTAAGNDGLTDWKYVLAPADGDQVIAVGAVDTLGVRPGWSSIGPTYDGRIKPDVMACGWGTYAGRPYSSSLYWRTMGTSVATPLVAGVAALLIQIDSRLTPAQVGDALRFNASRAENPDNYYGWGIVNANAARWGVSPQALPSATLRNYPNPFSENTIIFFEISKPTQADVAILTLAGELVRELSLFCELDERCEVLWDGRNQDGEQVADGVYLCQVVTDDDVLRGKMVRLRR